VDRDSAVAATSHPRALKHVFDGCFTLNEAGGGVILISPKGDWLLYLIWLHFCVTNNMAEYEALINDLHIAVELWV
jgi:hypothetical protein